MDPQHNPHPDPNQNHKNPSKFQTLQQQVPQQIRQAWTQQQNKIRSKIIYNDDHPWTMQTLKLICGVDLSANKNQPNLACVGLVVYNIQQHKTVYQDYQTIQINQPYIPGYLAFRQIPPLYSMFMKLKQKYIQYWPQLIIIDGNGILHSNQCGLACHLGVLLNVPTLGVGKTLFYIDGLGKQQVKQLCQNNIKKQNDYVQLVGKSGRVWGAGLRNGKNATNPVFVSIGTKISLQIAIKCVILSSIYRVPQPVRLADKKSREIIENINIKDIEKYKKYDMVYLDQLK